jgi:hypothetical protein
VPTLSPADARNASADESVRAQLGRHRLELPVVPTFGNLIHEQLGAVNIEGVVQRHRSAGGRSTPPTTSRNRSGSTWCGTGTTRICPHSWGTPKVLARLQRHPVGRVPGDHQTVGAGPGVQLVLPDDGFRQRPLVGADEVLDSPRSSLPSRGSQLLITTMLRNPAGSGTFRIVRAVGSSESGSVSIGTVTCAVDNSAVGQ